jgi:tRNA U55 pseudouridine synthase TruB
MTALERVLSEPFTLEESIKLDALTPDAALIPIETALSWMPSLVLPEIPELLKRLSNGVSTDLSEFDTDNSNAQLYRVFIGEVFWGIAERRPNGVFMKKLMIG